MSENPYESPKEPGTKPTVKAGIALGVLLLVSIPAGCICGSITCYSVAASGLVVAPPSSDWPGVDSLFRSIPFGLVVVVLIPVLAVLFFGKRKNTR